MRLSQGVKDQEFKVVVLGDKGAGKTSLVTRFIDGCYSPVQQSTIGAFFLTKKIALTNGSSYKMQLWDTAGQERFRSMAKLYYRGAAAVIVCCDITNEESFTKMKDWVVEIQSNSTEDFFVVLSCNKCDLEASRVVSVSRVATYAQEINAKVFLTSAKENMGVAELFSHISNEIYEKKMKDSPTNQEPEVRGLDLNSGVQLPSGKKGCC